jgi:protein arginine N-methyltransferase 1
MYSIYDYGRMIADEIRMDAYVEALKRAVSADTVVLDIGTGTGIFAMLACQFGARHVYAVEPNDAIHLARKITNDNGWADRITFIQELSTRITLPERAHVVISDLRGILPYYQAHIPSIVDARQRHLAPGGRLIPQQDTMWAVVVAAPHQYKEGYAQSWVSNKYGLNMEAAQHIVTNVWSKGKVKPEQFLVEPQPWATLDYMTIECPNVRAELSWTADRTGVAHGLSVWFDTRLAENSGFSNAPALLELVYGNAFFPWTSPVPLSAGDQISVVLEANLVGDDYIWRWDTRILSQNGSGRVKASFKQSTFHGLLWSPAQLSKKAAHYVPTLSEDGEMDRWILRMMDGSKSLGEIADALTQRFPQRFVNWNDALARGGKLSQRYSR